MDCGAGAGFRGNGASTADGFYTLAHIAQAIAAAGNTIYIEAAAVVGNLERGGAELVSSFQPQQVEFGLADHALESTLEGALFADDGTLTGSVHIVDLPDPDLAYLVEGTPEFDTYIADMLWAQAYAFASRQKMMDAAQRSLLEVVGRGSVVKTVRARDLMRGPPATTEADRQRRLQALLEEALHLVAALRESVAHRLLANLDARIRPHSVLGQQPPELGLAAEAAQDAEQQPDPQGEPGKHERSTGSSAHGLLGRERLDRIAQEPLDLAWPLRFDEHIPMERAA